MTQDAGTEVKAEIIGADRISDLAVLQLPGNGYPSLPLRENGNLLAGDWVIAIGNALALPVGPTVTVGVVLALGRSIEASTGITCMNLSRLIPQSTLATVAARSSTSMAT